MIYDYKKKYFKVKREIPIKPIIIFFIALITLFLLFRQKSTPYPKDDSLKVIPLSTETKNKPAPKDLTALETEINKIIKEKTGTYSVYFNDFSTGAEIGINQNMGFIAASVNKIPILAAVYYFANQGEIDLDQKITIQASDIQDYGTGIIRYEQPGVIYSLKTLARLMMEKDLMLKYVLFPLVFMSISTSMVSPSLTSLSLVSKPEKRVPLSSKMTMGLPSPPASFLTTLIFCMIHRLTFIELPQLDPARYLPGVDVPALAPAYDEALLEILVVLERQRLVSGGVKQQRQGQLGGPAAAIAPLETVRQVIV